MIQPITPASAWRVVVGVDDNTWGYWADGRDGMTVAVGDGTDTVWFASQEAAQAQADALAAQGWDAKVCSNARY